MSFELNRKLAAKRSACHGANIDPVSAGIIRGAFETSVRGCDTSGRARPRRLSTPPMSAMPRLWMRRGASQWGRSARRISLRQPDDGALGADEYGSL